MMKLSKKAYTLSEFILLLVLGIFFIGAFLSTYLRRVATRQAREAEAVMRAVRYEQEDLCFAGRKYEVYAKDLKALSPQKQTSKSLAYDLGSGKGISVRSKFYGFTLQMPSYADGRLCCDNCKKLNRYYSSCELLLRRPDFVEGDPSCFAYSVSNQPTEVLPVSSEETSTQPSVEKEPTAPQENTPAEKSVPAQTVQPPFILPIVIQMPVSSMPSAPSAQTQEALPQTQKANPSGRPAHDADTGSMLLPSEKPFVSSVQEDVQQPLDAASPVPARLCEAPQETGTFYTVACNTYQEGTQGTVLFTWNAQMCQYEAEQHCVIPAAWKDKAAITREEKGVYPSDIDKLCPQLLEELGCAPEVVRGKECFEPGESCYTRCEITQQNPTADSDVLVLYDVSLSLRRLQCGSSQNVTVQIP